jgi:phenylacetate-CoA ligase
MSRFAHWLSSGLYPRLPIFAQNAACTLAGYGRSAARFSPRFRDRLAELEGTAESPLEELRAIQHRRLDRLVSRARSHVPFYRDLPPPSAHPDPSEAIQRTLSGIPPLEKSTYCDRAHDFLADDIARSRLRRARTSGTTGTALPLWHTRDDLAEEYAVVWRLRRRCGANPDDANLTFNGQSIVPFSQAEPPFWRRNAWARQTLFSIYHMTPLHLRSYVDAIHETPARYVQGYPSAIHLAARALLEAGRPVPKGRFAAVFTSSESLLAFQRETIEAGFGAPVRDRYGVSELCVSMVGCEANRLHVDMEFGIVEVEVEEETEDWVRGALLVTGFAQEATPRFRYRIGDVGTRSKRACPCGRPGEVFLDVDGRIEDYVATPDGRLVGRMDHVFKDQHDVAEAQILQEDARSIEVLLVPRGAWRAETERGVTKELRSRLGEEIEIRIRAVEAIAREPNGKFRAVKSAVGRIAG